MKEKEVANIGSNGVVNISVDIRNMTVALIADGVIIPATDIFLDKFNVDGEQFINFSYTIESIGPNGMKERRQFFLPKPGDASIASEGELNDLGLASKIVNDDEKARADIIEFFKKDKTS